ncbi:MAG: hypothetical protein AVDCRST_MAG27-1576, partial [uncultured Craurococcus sp.]
ADRRPGGDRRSPRPLRPLRGGDRRQRCRHAGCLLLGGSAHGALRHHRDPVWDRGDPGLPGERRPLCPAGDPAGAHHQLRSGLRLHPSGVPAPGQRADRAGDQDHGPAAGAGLAGRLRPCLVAGRGRSGAGPAM